MLSLLLGPVLLASAAWHAAPAADACQLLTADEIRGVQQSPLKERKGAVNQSRGLRYEQCVFATDDFVQSVSLTVISGSGEATREYWTAAFRPQRTEAALAKATRKKDLPRHVSDLGDDAFWTGDTRAGALYVLTGDRVLRVSIGGASDPEDRLRRTHALAKAALARLDAPPPTP
jgi:hypothetical protein